MVYETSTDSPPESISVWSRSGYQCDLYFVDYPIDLSPGNSDDEQTPQEKMPDEDSILRYFHQYMVS